MKKDVNFGLGIIIVILLVSIVGISIYYNNTYRQVNLDYKRALENIKRTRDELNQTAEEIRIKNEELLKKEKVLIDIINELNLSKQRVTSLGEYYTSLKGEKETLETKIDGIEDERNRWKSDYTSAKIDLDTCNADYTAMQFKLTDVNVSLSRLQGMGSDIEAYVSDAQGCINDIKNVKITGVKNDVSALSNHIKTVDDACENESIDDIQDDLQEDADDIYKGVDDIKDVVLELEKVLGKINERIE